MKPKIRTRFFWHDINEVYYISFKVSWYQEDGEPDFYEKIYPVLNETEYEDKILGMLVDGIKTWLAHYKLDWQDFIIEDKRVYAIFNEEIAEIDIPF